MRAPAPVDWELAALRAMISRGRGSLKGEVSPHHRWIVEALLRSGDIENRASVGYELYVTEQGKCRVL